MFPSLLVDDETDDKIFHSPYQTCLLPHPPPTSKHRDLPGIRSGTNRPNKATWNRGMQSSVSFAYRISAFPCPEVLVLLSRRLCLKRGEGERVREKERERERWRDRVREMRE